MLSCSLWPTSQILQKFLQVENWLTWAQGRRSPDTTGRIYSSVCVAAPLGLQHWKHRQVVEDKVVNRREGNNEDWPGGLEGDYTAFSYYSFSHIIVAGFRELAVTWGEKEERGKWQEIEEEDINTSNATLALPLAQNDGRAQVLQC